MGEIRKYSGCNHVDRLFLHGILQQLEKVIQGKIKIEVI